MKLNQLLISITTTKHNLILMLNYIMALNFDSIDDYIKITSQKNKIIIGDLHGDISILFNVFTDIITKRYNDIKYITVELNHHIIHQSYYNEYYVFANDDLQNLLCDENGTLFYNGEKITSLKIVAINTNNEIDIDYFKCNT